MPVIEIKGIGARVKQTLDYIKNEEKTNKELWENIVLGDTYEDALKSVYDYATQENKTMEEKQYYVSGINCDPQNAVVEFKEVAESYGKWGEGLMAHHGWVSFPKGFIISPQECHDFTMRLLKEQLGDRFQIVVTTHVDREHIHSHFLINAVSFKDGRKFTGNQTKLWELRRASDELAMKYGYPVIDNPRFYGTDRGLYRAELRGERTWRDLVKKDIDMAIKVSDTMDDFYAELKKIGYKLKLDRKHPAISPPNMVDGTGKRLFIRLRSLKDNGYTIEGIKSRIDGNYYRELPPISSVRITGRAKAPRPKRVLPRYERRYYRFMYNFGLLRKKPKRFNYYSTLKYQKLAKDTEKTLEYIRKSHFNGEDAVRKRLNEIAQERAFLYRKKKSLKKDGETAVFLTEEEIDDRLADLKEEKRICDRIIAIMDGEMWKLQKRELPRSVQTTVTEDYTKEREKRK